ncbi:copper chaperone PCu(A)C [Nocardioides sp. AN3]
MMTTLRRLRTQRALAVAGLVAVAAPLLSSCGFDYATDRPNVIANGGYYIYGDVQVLGARIIAPSEGTGTFVATISVDPQGENTKLTGVSGDGITAGQFQPIEIKANSSVNLYTEGGVPVTGSFAAGDSVPLKLTFDNGDTIDLNAVVVKQCHEYADVKTASSGRQGRQSSSSASSSASASASSSASPSASSSASSSASASASESPSASSSGEPYTCEYPSVPALTPAE